MKRGMGWACDVYGGNWKCVQDFGGVTCGKELLGRPRRRWTDIIKIDLYEGMGRYGLDWYISG
jgi:hypothetical protein